MAKKSNFKKAMDELLMQGNQEKKDQDIELETIDITGVDVAAETVELPKIDFTVAKEGPAKSEEAIIPADMIINGNISTKSNMRVMGAIVGDVDCAGSIQLLGSIQGNVNAGNLTIQKGALSGDVSVKETIVIEDESTMKGNLTAKNIYSNARTQGQMYATAGIELREKAIVEGDIRAGVFSVSKGAKVKGMVTIDE